MTKTIMVGASKGGVGKSTICCELAILQAIRGEKVAVIECDDQGTTSDFKQFRDQNYPDKPNFEVFQRFGDISGELLRIQKMGFDFIFIDVSGRNSPEMHTGLIHSDILLCPTGVNFADYSTFNTVVELVNNARKFNPTLISLVIMNRIPRDINSVDVRKCVAYLNDFPEFKLLRAYIKERRVFARGPEIALSVHEYTPRDQKAIQEMNTLTRELLNHVK